LERAVTEVILKKREARAGEIGLFVVDEQGDEVLSKIKLGRDIGCEVIQRRNPKHHRLFFAILKFLQLHAERFEETPIEKIKDAVKLATGLVDTFVDAETGKTYYVLRSIAWAAMEQTAFDAFFDSACKVIASRWMPAGTTAVSVREELLKMIEDPRWQGSRVA
jgi:hypothetical protein